MVNAFFNSNLYLARNPDLVAAGLHTAEQLWDHYVNYGAQESSEGLRTGPNNWFDLNYYLGNNPDLVAAGVTAGQALDHYFTYGIYEGRAFNATIRADQFDAETYAADNADVAAALGIAEGAELTEADVAGLLKHYLAWGYAEGRKGAGEIANEVLEQNEREISYLGKGEAEVGTIANDEFTVTGFIDANAIIDGLAGNDTVIFKSDVTADEEDLSDAVILRSIENVEVVGVEVDANVVSKLDSVKLSAKEEAGKLVSNANATLLFADALVAGSADVLNVEVGEQADVDTTDADSTVLSVNGFETVNLALDAKFEGGIIVGSSETQGANQTVTLSGAKKDAEVGILFENAGSPELTNLTIDASGLAAKLAEIDLGDQVVNVANITIKGSTTAANAIDLSGETFETSQTVTVVGGDKDDTFTATTAIDVFTGGKGVDTFVFATATATALVKDGKVTAVDTITDFKKDDVLEVTSAASAVSVIEPVTGVNHTTLESWLLKGNDGGALAAGDAFNFGGDAYVVVTEAIAGEKAGQVASVELIKLVGVNAADLGTDKAGTVEFVA